MGVKRILTKVVEGRGWLLIGIAICIAINLMPTPRGLTIQGQRALGLLGMVVIFFFTGAIPLPGVALLIASYQIVIGGKSFDEVPPTFMHDAVFFIIGALMIAVVLVKHNIHKRVSVAILEKAGTSVTRVVFGIIFITSIVGIAIPGHIKSAFLLPVGIGIVACCGGFEQVPNLAKLLMLAISYGCKVGGVATPAAGTRNILMIGYLRSFSNVQLGFGQWMLYAVPFTLIMIPVVGFSLLKMFKPEITDLSSVLERTKKDLGEIGPMNRDGWVVTLLFISTLVLWITMSKTLGLGNIAIMIALAYLLLRLVDWEDYQNGVNWGVILLYMGALSLGRYLDDAGTALWIARAFLAGSDKIFGSESKLLLMGSTTTLTALSTNAMSAGATVAVLGPIVLKVAELANIPPVVMGLSCSMASAFAWLMIIGTPSNAIVYSSGFLKPSDFLKAGWVMMVASLFVLIVVVGGLYWRYVLHLW